MYEDFLARLLPACIEGFDSDGLDSFIEFERSAYEFEG